MADEFAISEVQQDAAPFLFSLPEAEKQLEVLEAAGQWTGERLFAKNPQVYAAIVRMLGTDYPVQTIARLLAVSDNTVRSVRSRESAAIADFRAKQGVKRRKALDALMDRIIEEAPSADLKDATIAYGILDDKERLDSGAPTQRIEVTVAPAQDVYQDLIKSIVDVSAEVVPVTGLSGTIGGQMGDRVGGLELPLRGVSDVESDVLQGETVQATAETTEEGGVE